MPDSTSSPRQEMLSTGSLASPIESLVSQQSDTEGWASDEERDANNQIVEEQAAEAGIGVAQIESLYEDMRKGHVLLADALGFSAAQLSAMSYRANELLRSNEPRRALSIYLALYELDPYDYKYQRGAAQCFHTIKQYGFALGYYRLAMATLGDKDFVCLAMIAECLLPLYGKASCMAALDEALALGTTDKQEQIYVERAKAFRQRIAANDSL